MQSNIQKWGNSLAVRIPKQWADELHITADSSVNITLDAQSKSIVITASNVVKKYSLEELLEKMPDNVQLQEEPEPCISVGREHLRDW